MSEPTDEINLDSVQSVGSLDLSSENSRRRTCDVYPLVLFVIANTPFLGLHQATSEHDLVLITTLFRLSCFNPS
jgi:hypothetical protein